MNIKKKILECFDATMDVALDALLARRSRKIVVSLGGPIKIDAASHIRTLEEAHMSDRRKISELGQALCKAVEAIQKSGSEDARRSIRERPYGGAAPIDIAENYVRGIYPGAQPRW